MAVVAVLTFQLEHNQDGQKKGRRENSALREHFRSRRYLFLPDDPVLPADAGTPSAGAALW